MDAKTFLKLDAVEEKRKARSYRLIGKDQLEVMKFFCGYCGYAFERYVGTSSRVQKQCVRDQVPCLRCGNFLKVNKK